MTQIQTETSSVDAVILRPAQLPAKDRGNGATTVPLVGAHLGATSLLNGITSFAPGAAIGHHSHNVVESVVVIEGTAWVDINGDEHYMDTYDTTFVPANIVHRFRNASDTEPMRILWTYASIDATRTPAGSTTAHRIDAEQTDPAADQPAPANASDTTGTPMVHETALLRITEGQNQAFEAAAAQAAPLFQQAEGALSFRLDQRIENSNEYVLTVGWTTMAAHTEHFRSSPAFTQWRELVSPYFATAPEVHHTTHIHTGF